MIFVFSTLNIDKRVLSVDETCYEQPPISIFPIISGVITVFLALALISLFNYFPHHPHHRSVAQCNDDVG